MEDMSLNNVKATGDDQAWKAQVEKIIAELLVSVQTLGANK